MNILESAASMQKHGDGPVDGYFSRLIDKMTELTYGQSTDNNEKCSESQWIVQYTTHYDGYK